LYRLRCTCKNYKQLTADSMIRVASWC